MKVLHVYRTHYPETQGGIEEHLRQLCRGLRACAVESRILTVSPHGPFVSEVEGTRVIAARRLIEWSSTGLSLDFSGKLSEQSQWADLVHYQFPWPMADVAQLLSRQRQPYIVSYQSDIVRQRVIEPFYRPLGHRFLAGARAIVASTPIYATSSPWLARHRDRLQVIPLGLDEVSVDPERVQYWRHEVGEDFFLFVGVLRYYKGLHLLIDAARQQQRRVLIVGQGPLDKDLRAQAEGVPHIQFLGRVDDADKFALLALARAFVFPSHLRSEAYGLSLVEAAMMGKAMITSDMESGPGWINVDGETGLCVKSGDSAALLTAMQRLDRDHAAAQRMGQAARRRYRAVLRSDLMCRAYARLYAEVLA